MRLLISHTMHNAGRFDGRCCHHTTALTCLLDSCKLVNVTFARRQAHARVKVPAWPMAKRQRRLAALREGREGGCAMMHMSRAMRSTSGMCGDAESPHQSSFATMHPACQGRLRTTHQAPGLGISQSFQGNQMTIRKHLAKPDMNQTRSYIA